MVTRYFHKTQNVEALGKEIKIILKLFLVINQRVIRRESKTDSYGKRPTLLEAW